MQMNAKTMHAITKNTAKIHADQITVASMANIAAITIYLTINDKYITVILSINSWYPSLNMFWHADWSLRSNERMIGKILTALFSVSDTNFSLKIDGAIWSCEENNFGGGRIKLH